MSMQNDQRLIDHIESCLRGELSEQESTELKKLCLEDSFIQAKLDEHQKMMQHLADYGQRRQLIAEVEIAHQQFLNSAKKESPISFKIKAIWNKYRVDMAVAASVAVLAVLSTLAVTGYFSKSESNYSVLRREVNSLKRSQSVLIKTISRKSTDVPSKAGRFGGTGFLISPNGYIATNYHIVQGAGSIYVQNMDGESFDVKQIYVDPACDLAVLQIVDPHFHLPASLPYTFKKSLAELGEDVFTIGFPEDKAVYGKGYLSSNTGYAGDPSAYQVSIPVNPGNSGGPLLDSRGNIVGMISGKQTHTDGAAFAIKSTTILESLADISEDDLEDEFILSKKNTLASLDRKTQIKKLHNCIFMVKAY